MRHTGYEDLAIVEKHPNLPRLDSNEVRVTLWFRVFQEFVIDTLDQLASTDQRTYITSSARIGPITRSQGLCEP